MSHSPASTVPKRPSAFISYSQTPVLADGSKAPTEVVIDHKTWVRELANRLRGEASIDAILDQTHLQPGQDAYKFMEQTVAAHIDKVIIIVDLAYTKKANAGEGGVGTESQIISPEIYNHAEQTKFIGVLRQRDESGKAKLPPWLKTTIWIDMSSDDLSEENFETLVRAIYDKPLHTPAPLGKTPSYLESSAPQSPASVKIRSAQSAVQGAKPNASGLVHDALDAVRDDLLAHTIDNGVERGQLDQALMTALEKWTPRRDEYLGLIKTCLRYEGGRHLIGLLPQFFQSFLPTVSVDFEGQRQRLSHIEFALYELWLQTVSLMLESRSLEPLSDLLHSRYRCQQHGRPFVARYTVFRPWDSNYMESVKKRIDSQKWLSPLGQLLKERANENIIAFERICEADILLWLCDILITKTTDIGGDGNRMWWMYTSPYITGHWGEGISRPEAFEFLDRCSSRVYFERFRPVIGVESATDLRSRWEEVFTKNFATRSEGERASIAKKTNEMISKVASHP